VSVCEDGRIEARVPRCCLAAADNGARRRSWLEEDCGPVAEECGGGVARSSAGGLRGGELKDLAASLPEGGVAPWRWGCTIRR